MELSANAIAAQAAARQPNGEFGTQPHTESGIVDVAAPDLRFDTDEWAFDIGRVLHRAAPYRSDLELNQDQRRRIATRMLHGFSNGGLTEAARLRRQILSGSQIAPSRFTVDYWADDLEEAILEEAHGSARFTRQELRIAANLLLHGQEDEWIPQAARLRAEAQPADHVTCSGCGREQWAGTAEVDASDDLVADGWTLAAGRWTCMECATRAAQITRVCEECGREFSTDSRNPGTHCTVCVVAALRDSVEAMKVARAAAELERIKPAGGATPLTDPHGCAVCGGGAKNHIATPFKPGEVHAWTRPSSDLVQSRIMAARRARL